MVPSEMSKDSPCLGSGLDEFLAADGILDAVEAGARTKVIAAVKSKRFAELRAKMTPEARQRSEARAAALLAELEATDQAQRATR